MKTLSVAAISKLNSSSYHTNMRLLSRVCNISCVCLCSCSSVGPDIPQIDVTPYTMTERGYSALERETVSLLCQAQSNPASQYVWFYNNSQVYTGPQFTITKILRMHTGDYACLAQNTYLNTRSKKTISLTVYCECETSDLGLPLFALLCGPLTSDLTFLLLSCCNCDLILSITNPGS